MLDIPEPKRTSFWCHQAPMRTRRQWTYVGYRTPAVVGWVGPRRPTVLRLMVVTTGTYCIGTTDMVEWVRD
ncbi:hypothetical protein PM082_007538 [Marasmius tenuissimus]|nr:hypothetical protein PM082_007538 [Marasmius tenuissimus]